MPTNTAKMKTVSSVRRWALMRSLRASASRVGSWTIVAVVDEVVPAMISSVKSSAIAPSLMSTRAASATFLE